MTERFTLAANVLLSRRLQNLLRIDENVEIDMTYITCAEYQLFIDEKLKVGEHRQPDHWTSYRFPPGDAKKPITGIRFSDTEEFCEWLTQQQSELGFKYRLPTLSEVKEYPVIENQVGCWCFDGQQRILAGIETGQRQTWQQNLVEVLILNRELDRDIERDIYRDIYRELYSIIDRKLYSVLDRKLDRILDRVLYGGLDHDLNHVLYGDLDHVLDRVLYGDLDRDIDRDLYGDLYHVLYRIIYRDIEPDIERNLCGDLYRILYRNLDCDLYRVLDRDLYRDLYRVLYHNIEGKIKAIEASKASDFLLLYFPVLPVIVIYHFLLTIYEVISQNQEALNTIKLSREESEAISGEYLENFNKIYPLYVYLILLDERQAGRMPAWESIRIVRERVE